MNYRLAMCFYVPAICVLGMFLWAVWFCLRPNPFNVKPDPSEWKED